MPVTILIHQRNPESEEPYYPPLVFASSRVVLGRGEACDVRLPDTSVSNRHASIRAHGSQYMIVDEGSTNGTKLNGARLSPQAQRPLQTGDELRLGRICITVKLGAATATPQQTSQQLALSMMSESLGINPLESIVLIVTAGPDQGQSLVLADDVPKVIGRDPRCPLRLTDRSVPPMAVEVAQEKRRVRVTRKDERGECFIDNNELSAGQSVFMGNQSELLIGMSTLRIEDKLAKALSECSSAEDEQVNQPAVIEEKKEEPEASPEAETAKPMADVAEEKPKEDVAKVVAPAATRPRRDRRSNFRGATAAIELIALILSVLVLMASIAGIVMLFKKSG